MLNMKEKAILVIVSALAAALTASLIRASFTIEVELVSSPSGPVINAPAGKPFNVTCRALGGDKRKFFMRWLDSEENAIAAGIPGVVADGDSLLLLTFTHPKSEDSGKYKCTAVYDGKHNLQYAVDIVFYGPEPKFEKDFENITVTEEERVEAYCSALGEKPITYEWYNQRGDGINDKDKSIFVSSDSDGSKLIIEGAKLHHEGMYTCRASNSHGLSSKLYYIAVSPKPGNDTDNRTSFFQDISVVNVSANSVQFKIVISGFAEGIEVMYREKVDASEHRTTFYRLAPDDIYSIENLIPSGSYVFQFRILPLESNSEWSKTFQVILLPDMPEITIRRLEKSSIEFEWFRKFDDVMRETIDKHEIKYYTVQMQSGNYWTPSTCVITIKIPSCSSSYTLSGLQQKVYYQIEVRAHTESGYGAPAKQKIYIPG